MQEITIENLGAVKYFKSEITKYMILIGEQGTGKSTIAKSIYFFRNIKTEIINYFLSIFTNASHIYNTGAKSEDFTVPLMNQVLGSALLETIGYKWDFNGFKMSYDFGNDISIQISIDKTEDLFRMEYSSKFVAEIQTLGQQMMELLKNLNPNDFLFISQERARINKEITEKVNHIFNDDLDTFYIPAGRSLFTLLANQKTRLDYASIDLVNRNFMNLIESLQSNFDLGIDKVHEHFPADERDFDVGNISKIITDSLKGNYKYVNGKEYFVVSENTSIPLNYASSGQQEMLWILNQLYVLMLSKTKSFVIIEEPEAHLFPELQKDIVDFISIFSNLNDSTVLITTHSPYILTSANTLLYADRLKKISRKKSDEVIKIMGRHRYFSSDNFSAYMLSVNNEFENIVDSETGEIMSEKIDEVSNKISEEYTKLFYLEEGAGN